MSRLYSKNGRGRQPAMAAPRILKIKDFANENFPEPNSKRKRKVSKHATLVQQAKRRRKAATPSSSESSDDFDAEDASEEQSEDDEVEDDDDLPAVDAPSHLDAIGETGRIYDQMRRAGSVDSMFGENGLDGGQDLPTLEDMRRFEENLFANASDDDAYAAVEDISDSDEEAIDQHEEQRLIAELSESDGLEELDLLNQIDGMSAYGFGDDSEATAQYPPSSQGSDSADEVGPTRHVHFNVDPARAFNPSLSESPTLSRALLPSALPDSAPLGVVKIEAHDNPDSDEDYDTDATDECLPPEAQFQDEDEEGAESPEEFPTPRTAARKKADCKGPPRGIFIDEGTKATGMLDKTGKIMLITHPHLLGDEFARRYGNSAASSPAAAFDELLSESDFAETANYSNITLASDMDVMLNHGNIIDVNGVATGPQEAFFPLGFNPRDFTDDFDLGLDNEDDLGEDVIKMDDVIKFDDDSDDSEAATSPLFRTPKAPSSQQFWAPSASTVTAFRRHQDSFKTTPSFSRFTELSSPQSALTSSRKRKTMNESPYASAHYKGVTPVQRMTNTENILPSTPDTVRPTKRRRLMTA